MLGARCAGDGARRESRLKVFRVTHNPRRKSGMSNGTLASLPRLIMRFYPDVQVNWEKNKAALWGPVGGGIVLAIIGFAWRGVRIVLPRTKLSRHDHLSNNYSGQKSPTKHARPISRFANFQRKSLSRPRSLSRGLVRFCPSVSGSP